MSRVTQYCLILLLIFGVSCSKKDKDVSPDVDETTDDKPTQVEDEGSPKSNFLESSEPFYPLKETVEDIQKQMNDLRARVIEYETRVSTPSFNTEVLKMIKIPQLKHEISLTNGTLIQGTILQENMDQLIIQTHIGQLTIDKGNVKSIKEIAPSSANVVFEGDAEEKIMNTKRNYTGNVRNTGLERADFVRVIYNLWGGETELISTDSVFVEGSQIVYRSGVITDTALNPGEEAEFNIDISLPEDTNVQYVTREIHWDSYE